MLRRLGPVDLTLVTIGGIIGSGIFRNPAVVAQRAHLPSLILWCWIAGGIVAIVAAFVFAELAERRPHSGGLYAYLSDAFHPAVAFVFGWTLLLVSDTGGTAASAVLFAGYLTPLTGFAWDPRVVAATTLALLTAINCAGVSTGKNWQNVLVVLKVSAIGLLIVAGLFAHPHAVAALPPAPFATTGALLGAFGVAMLPVLFAYNGFQSTSYMTAESRDPQRTIPRGLLLGVGAVVTIYVLVNVGCLRVLGPIALAASKTPAADVMQAAFGSVGGRFIAAAIALSTLGFMSTRMLVAPRIYYQMAADGAFFKPVAWIHPKSRVPVIAIALEGLVAGVIAVSGTFDQIVNWTVTPEWTFVFLAALALFVLRKRDAAKPKPAFRVPGHPFTTAGLMAVLLAILVAELAISPLDTLFGGIVMVSGIAFYFGARRLRLFSPIS